MTLRASGSGTVLQERIGWKTTTALYCCLSVAYCWPLFLSFNTGLPNDTGDPGLLAYLIWWNAQVWPFSQPWWNVPMFFPQAGVIAFSESFVGVAPFTSPLIWAGIGAVATHNALFVASIATAALAAHGLARHLTGRHDVAFIAGLAFGFSPYRASQMPHVHLLVTCWMAIGLLALHRYVRYRRPLDLLWLGSAWLLNGLTSGYYLVFFAVLVGLWMLWFLRDMKAFAAVGMTLVVASAPILLLLAGYTEVHRGLGFARGRDEIETFSADLSAFWVASFHAWLPRQWSLPSVPEGELYPGLAIVLLTAAGAFVAWRRLEVPPRLRLRRWLFVAGVLLLGAAAVSLVTGGWRLDFGVFALSFTRPFRIVSAGVWLLVIAVFSDPRWLGAWRRRSVFAFYGLAACAMAVFALGPVGRVFGHRFLHLAPYSWLMEFPGGDSLRAPARFGMLVMLCLAIAASIALSRLIRHRARPWLIGVLCALVLAEGWVPNMLVAPVRPAVSLPGLDANTVVLEVPMRDLYSDTAAMLRATEHKRPLVNGFSGYGPPHYATLTEGLRSGDPSVIQTLRELAPLAVLVNRTEDPTGSHEAFISRADGAQLVYRTPVGPVYRFPRAFPRTRSATAPRLRVTSVQASVRPEVAWALVDDRPDTQWQTAGPQALNDQVSLTFERDVEISRVQMDLGAEVLNYPRELRIDARTSDGETRTVWQAGTAGATVAGILADRVRLPVVIDLPRGTVAKTLLLTLSKSHPAYYWTISDIHVFGR